MSQILSSELSRIRRSSLPYVSSFDISCTWNVWRLEPATFYSEFRASFFSTVETYSSTEGVLYVDGNDGNDDSSILLTTQPKTIPKNCWENPKKFLSTVLWANSLNADRSFHMCLKICRWAILRMTYGHSLGPRSFSGFSWEFLGPVIWLW